MQANDQFKNHYPRSICNKITISQDSPIYRRSDTGQSIQLRGSPLDTRWVIPYDPYSLWDITLI